MRGGDLEELERLSALSALELLDSAPDADLDQIARLAAGLYRVPVALITITAEKRNWFKARFGTDLCESPRETSFCTWAIQGDGLFEVPDLKVDERFAGNPLVTGPLAVRYYAGMPIMIGRHAIGTLCILDFVPREPLDPVGRQRFGEMVGLVVRMIEARQLRRVGAIAEAVGRATPDAIICFDATGMVTSWNPAAEALFGCRADEIVRHSVDRLLPPAVREELTRDRLAFLDTGVSQVIGRTVEITVLGCDGRVIPVELSLASWTESDGTVGFGAIVRDLTARHAMEAERAAAQRFTEDIAANLPSTLFVKDANTREYLLLNRAGEELTGYAQSEVLGRTDGDLWPEEAAAAYRERDDRVLETGMSESFEEDVTRADGRTRIMRTKRVSIRDEAGRPLYLLGIGEDVTEWRRAQRQLAFAAGHDGLTGLHNRDHFLWALEAALAEERRPGDRRGVEVALLALDLDRFSSIVGAYGRTIADELLVDVAARLRLTLKPGAIAARFDADRFFVMLTGPGAGQQAEVLARELLSGLATCGAGRAVRARIGIAVSPRDGDTAETLVASAEMASLRAKSVGVATTAETATGGGWRIAFFERAQDDAAKRRRRIEERLAAAIDAGRIDVHYQPLIEIAGGRIAGFEALARWNDAELGEVSPVEFIPVAEANGLIAGLGAIVLRRAASEAAGWSETLRLSVNFSAAQFADPALADAVAAALARAGLPAHRLEVEITESLLIAPHARVLETLRNLKAMGSTIAMDDFGTGYSSLSYFCSFPFDKVKIDQAFIRDMTAGREARAIVRAVIGLAHGMGMQVAAEGIETPEQLAALSAEGCDLAQGFLIGRPAAAAAWGSATRMAAPVHRRAVG